MALRLYVFAAGLITSFTASAHATEVATYVYDAKGRLVQVVRTGGPSSGMVTIYGNDKADNRTRVVVSGAVR